jgi:hypothetical protein
MGICDKIAEIETEIARTQKNKGECPVIFSVKSPTQLNLGVKIRWRKKSQQEIDTINLCAALMIERTLHSVQNLVAKCHFFRQIMSFFGTNRDNLSLVHFFRPIT